MTFTLTLPQILLLLLPFVIIIVGMKKRNGMLVAMGGMFLLVMSLALGFPFVFGTILFFIGILFMFTGVFL